jgi:hypothetical protein
VISIESKGGFPKTEAFLIRMTRDDNFRGLDRYGQEGVRALSAYTPKDTGETASSWTYQVIRSKGTYAIVWSNTNVVSGVPIAVLIQYGHGTRNGGWVQGRDYINPALRPVFDRIAEEAWKVVTSA